MKHINFYKIRSTRIIAMLLITLLIFTLLPLSMSYGASTSTVTKEGLITNVSNPSNGTITFYIHVPAQKTVNYNVKLVPSKRTGTIDKVVGSYKNTSNKTISKKITAKTKYYSNKYTVNAQYTTGNSKYKTVYKDTDKATSALKKQTFSSKVIWNAKNIKKWKNGNRVALVVEFGTTLAIDIFVSKGYLSGTLATAIGISTFVGDFAEGGKIYETKTIAKNPIKGWGYRIKAVPGNNGYSKYLQVFNDKGKLYKEYKIGTVSINRISPAIK